jgi:hypothetical protein
VTPQEESAAVLGYSLRSLAEDLKDMLRRSALEWGVFADKLDELERLHYDLYTFRSRLDAFVSGRGAGDRGE